MSTNQTDFSKIVLTNEEGKIFEKFKYKDQTILTKKEHRILLHGGFVESTIDGKSSWFDEQPEEGLCKISYKGIKYREYLKLSKKDKRAELIRYLITTGIAVTALIVAIISIVITMQSR